METLAVKTPGRGNLDPARNVMAWALAPQPEAVNLAAKLQAAAQVEVHQVEEAQEATQAEVHQVEEAQEATQVEKTQAAVHQVPAH